MLAARENSEILMNLHSIQRLEPRRVSGKLYVKNSSDFELQDFKVSSSAWEKKNSIIFHHHDKLQRPRKAMNL